MRILLVPKRRRLEKGSPKMGQMTVCPPVTQGVLLEDIRLSVEAQFWEAIDSFCHFSKSQILLVERIVNNSLLA